MSLYDINVKNAKGDDVSLNKYKGKVLLVVNVASQCGFTNQYDGLEKLYEEYSGKGLEVLGFPCNQFGGQEPGSDDEIQTFCTGHFGVKFPVFSKVEVNGSNTHPLYELLKKEARGIFGTKRIKWNFTKFLVGKDGKVLKRFAPTMKPEDMAAEIDKIL